MFWTWLFGITTFILFCLLGIAVFYLWRFTKIIMIFEDDINQATKTLVEVEQSMERINDLKLFFDDEEIRGAADAIKDSFRLAQFEVNKVIRNFTLRSKQKYIAFIEEEDNKEEEGEVGGASPELQILPSLPGEGAIANVERAKKTSG